MAEKCSRPEIIASVSSESFSVPMVYSEFIAREGFSTGTVVMHHGLVKEPGKQLPDFREVKLCSLVDDPAEGLRLIGTQAAFDHQLLRVLIMHRLGTVARGDEVLLVICSAVTRAEAFAGCAAIVDQIKREDLIALRELG